MNIMKKRRESVASVYKRTTKFLTTNTTTLLRIRSNSKRYNTTTANSDEVGKDNDKNDRIHFANDEEDLGERDLDYYMGVRKRETYWRDPSAIEQLRRDYLVYHCGVTEEEYEAKYKKSYPETRPLEIKPKLKQVPFKIHRKKKGDNKDDLWKEKSGIFKLFVHRKDGEYSTSDSYSECDSEDMASLERRASTAIVNESYSSPNSKDDSQSRSNKVGDYIHS